VELPALVVQAADLERVPLGMVALVAPEADLGVAAEAIIAEEQEVNVSTMLIASMDLLATLLAVIPACVALGRDLAHVHWVMVERQEGMEAMVEIMDKEMLYYSSY